MLDRIELPAAKGALEAILGQQIERIDPDTIAALHPDLSWTKLPLWSEMPDIEVAKLTGLLDAPGAVRMTFVTDPSFYPGGTAWSCPVDSLVPAFQEHRIATRERVFAGGDVVAWSTELGKVWLFHHEGLFAIILKQSVLSD
jgi:hypothetical protein